VSAQALQPSSRAGIHGAVGRERQLTAGDDEAALTVESLTLRFAGVTALEDVSVSVGRREIFSLIGPNGAGKTSLVNCATGYYRPTAGRISAFGTDVTGKRPHRIARVGVSRTYQNIELFRGMSVIDNLLLGRYRHMKANVITGGLWWGPARNEELRERRVVEELIDFLEIQHVRHLPVSQLSYGMRKRVDLGRALAMEPKLLILDEPMAGMNVEEKEDIARFVLEAHASRDLSVLLIEHDMGVVMDISDRVAVLDFGRLIAQGTPDEVSSDPAVIEAYVGEKALAERNILEV
jgi:branched-chain amino acid transport system ATP-binding protein